MIKKKKLIYEFKKFIKQVDTNYVVDEDELCETVCNAPGIIEGVVFGNQKETEYNVRTDKEAFDIFNSGEGDLLDAFLCPIYNLKNIKILKLVYQDKKNSSVEKKAIELMLMQENKSIDRDRSII